jgi:hypothetical protein
MVTNGEFLSLPCARNPPAIRSSGKLEAFVLSVRRLVFQRIRVSSMGYAFDISPPLLPRIGLVPWAWALLESVP